MRVRASYTPSKKENMCRLAFRKGSSKSRHLMRYLVAAPTLSRAAVMFFHWSNATSLTAIWYMKSWIEMTSRHARVGSLSDSVSICSYNRSSNLR